MFAWLLNFSLHKRLLVLVAALALMVVGALLLQRTPVDVFPDLNRPQVTLQIEAGGMAPEEVEQRITVPLEAAMGGLPGVASVRSVSSVGLAFVYISFGWDTEIYRARQMVAERLSSVREQLPAGISHAGMGPVSSIMGEIMLIAIPYDAQPEAKAGAEAIKPEFATREYADFVLRPRLLALPGVAQVIPIGGELRQYQVQPDAVRMAALGVSLDALTTALRGFSGNSSGGYVELGGREVLIRHIGREGGAQGRLQDLQRLPVAYANGRAILLEQVAQVGFAPALKRGDAGFNGQPAVMLGVQKQPGADTVALTTQIERALAEMKPGLPAGISAPQVSFRQASFIEASIGTLQAKLLSAAVIVAVVLYFFLANARTTLISLAAIPVSLLITVLVLRYFGLSINTMTLGGLAIALGELVDDAVVGVENTLRRLKENRQQGSPQAALHLILKATLEVRSAIVLASLIIVLVFLPLFFLPGIEGRLFMPLGLAYIVAILASMLVSVTLTPVLAFYLLPQMKSLDHAEPRAVRWIKRHYERALRWVLGHGRGVLAGAGVAVLLAVASLPFFARTFLPPFNEGAVLVGLRLNPGTTLEESVRIAKLAEQALAEVPEVVHVGRRSGRAELDEHAEGVHTSELDLKMRPSARSNDAVYAEMRARLAPLPVAVSIGQPISHRIDHMLSGVRSQIALKLYGDDLDLLRAEAERLRTALAGIRGLGDLEVEKQVLTPQLLLRVDSNAAERHGLAPAQLLAQLQTLVAGEQLAQVVEGKRSFGLVLRLAESARGPEALAGLMIQTPAGPLPLASLARIEDSDGPNQILRDEGKRRIVISANASERPLSEVVAEVRQVLAAQPLPPGYYTELGGQFAAQEEASRLIGLLSLASAALVLMLLYSRYQSLGLSLLIMANVPLALVGSVLALWISGQPLSVAALIGFITLAGISTRNGILKISHYVNLCAFEGQRFGPALLLRGSLERLTPVLMTALVAALALAPLLFEAERPGTEILHPVAVVIFGGLISSTLLDSFLTPVLVSMFGRAAIERLVGQIAADSAQGRAVEAF